MSDKPKSLIAGSTGLVGSLLLKEAQIFDKLSSGDEPIVLISMRESKSVSY